MKKRIAIIDFTDCEGCEVELLSLREDLLKLTDQLEIVNFRLAQGENKEGPYDIAIIEGNPTSEKDQTYLKKLRVESKYLGALGACAITGGLPALINEKERNRLKNLVYGKDYKPIAKEIMPLSHYVELDFIIPGCPPRREHIFQILSSLIAHETLIKINHNVCLECKANGNKCLLLEGQPCFGPITTGGCQANCPKVNFPCYGCFGILQGTNLEGFAQSLKEKGVKRERMKEIFQIFHHRSEEYKKLFGED